tara:strand:+ start:3878 stop:4369 length:492 start_codon:yes stop_codon:yes gene_type:complete
MSIKKDIELLESYSEVFSKIKMKALFLSNDYTDIFTVYWIPFVFYFYYVDFPFAEIFTDNDILATFGMYSFFISASFYLMVARIKEIIGDKKEYKKILEDKSFQELNKIIKKYNDGKGLREKNNINHFHLNKIILEDTLKLLSQAEKIHNINQEDKREKIENI